MFLASTRLSLLLPRPLRLSAARLASDESSPGADSKADGPGEKKIPPLYKRLWSGYSKDEYMDEEKSKEELLYQEDEALYLAMEEEKRREELLRKRNKSRLRFSDRQRLLGEPPLEGLELQFTDEHRSPEFRQRMLGLYGSKATGISPRICWPTRDKLEEYREWEDVFYDGETDLRQRIENDKRKKREEREAMLQKEAEIDRNFATMNREIKLWKERVESKNKHAQQEKEKREKVLAMLRQEYGYDLDPQNPHYAEKIAEKEKEIAKAEKKAKKLKKAEQKKAEVMKEAVPS